MQFYQDYYFAKENCVCTIKELLVNEYESCQDIGFPKSYKDLLFEYMSWNSEPVYTIYADAPYNKHELVIDDIREALKTHVNNIVLDSDGIKIYLERFNIDDISWSVSDFYK